MPVRVNCPHCRTPCSVAEQYLGVPLKCGRCGRTFTTRGESAASAPLARLDIGAAAPPRRGRSHKEDRFLVQRLVFCNLDERHELAVLVVADGSRAIPTAAAALAPLLGNLLNGTSKAPTGALETLTAACKKAGSSVAAVAVIWDGQASIGGVGDSPIYHHGGGRLTRLQSGPRKLAAGDSLVLTCAALTDEAAVQTEIAAARASAVELAERLVERAGSANSPIIVVRGY